MHPTPSWKLRIARLARLAGAVGLSLATLYCLLWVVSSSSMAFVECNGRYELFSSNAQCRQPPLAWLLALVFCVFAVSLAWLGSKLAHRSHNGA